MIIVVCSLVDARVVTSFGPGILPITTCIVNNGSSLSCTDVADASCDHSMDLGVVCRTYKQLYDELLAEQEQEVLNSDSHQQVGDQMLLLMLATKQ